jgi:hypothetical protein
VLILSETQKWLPIALGKVIKTLKGSANGVPHIKNLSDIDSHKNV